MVLPLSARRDPQSRQQDPATTGWFSGQRRPSFRPRDESWTLL